MSFVGQGGGGAGRGQKVSVLGDPLARFALPGRVVPSPCATPTHPLRDPIGAPGLPALSSAVARPLGRLKPPSEGTHTTPGPGRQRLAACSPREQHQEGEWR